MEQNLHIAPVTTFSTHTLVAVAAVRLIARTFERAMQIRYGVTAVVTTSAGVGGHRSTKGDVAIITAEVLVGCVRVAGPIGVALAAIA